MVNSYNLASLLYFIILSISKVLKHFLDIDILYLCYTTYYYFQETKPRAGVWKADKFSRSVQLSRWVVLNLDQRTNIASIK